MSCGCVSLLMNVTRSPTATISCRGSAPVVAIRMVGGSTGVGGVGPVDGAGDGLPDEPLPHVDAATASAPVTNEEKIFRRQ
jgi:hypothetical protein